MFRDLKEYQEIQNLYENKIYLSEDEEKKLEESLDFLESVDLSDEDLIYFFENIDQFIEDEELQNISEKIGFLKNIGKFKQGSLNFRNANLSARRANVLQTMKGTTRKPFQPVTTRKPFDPKAPSFLTKGVSSPRMAGGLRPLASFSPIKDRLKTAAGVALGAAGVTAAAAGISRLRAKADQEKKQEKIKDDGEKLIDTKVVDNIKKDNTEIKKDNEKKDNEIKKDNEKKDDKVDNKVDNKVDTNKVDTNKKKMSALERRNRDRFGDERVEYLKKQNKAFQDMKKGKITKDQFIKDFPKSITAQREQGLRDHKELDAYNMVLEYLLSTEQAATIEEANYVMTEMDAETIQGIVEEQKKNLNEIKLATAAKVAAPFVGLGLLGQLGKKDPVGNIRKDYQHNYNLKKLSGTGDSPEARDMLNIPRDYTLTPEEKKKYGFK